MTSKRELLKQFLLNNLEYIMFDGSMGTAFKHPNFELYARDYLNFAEKELESQGERSLINCVSYLKRAMDCHLDNFLYVFKLADLFHKRNLKFEKKLEFLKEAGVFSGRTLSRLNAIRNRMEHSYEIPKVQEIEAYFDLVAAFVAVLERTILLAGENQRYYLIIRDDESYQEHSPGGRYSKYNLSIEYEFDGPCITVKWNTEKDHQNLTVDTGDIYEFAYFFRIFILLALRYAFAGDKFVISQL